MLIYLGAFILSFLFLKIGQQYQLKVFTYIGLIIPIVIAGFRGINVGTDTSNYYDLYSIFEHENKYLPIVEPLFFIITKIAIAFNSFCIVLIIYETICIVFLYYAIKKVSSKIIISTAWVLLLYYLIAFNPSLNTMRQYAAMSYFLYITSFLFNKRYKLYIILSMIGIMLHSTIFVCSGIVLIIYKISILNNQKKKLTYTIGYIFSLLSMIIMLQFILVKLSSMGFDLISGKAESYQSNEAHIQSSYIVLTTFMLFVTSILKYYSKIPSLYIHFMMLTIITDLAFTLLGAYNIVFSRFANYFSIFYILYIPIAFKTIRIKQSQKKFFKLSCLSVFLIFWIWSIAINNSGATIPYSFS